MKSKISLQKLIVENDIVSPKKGVSTPLNAKIYVSGYGVLTRKQLQQSIKRHISDIVNQLNKSNFEIAYHMLFKNKVIKQMLETEIKHSGK